VRSSTFLTVSVLVGVALTTPAWSADTEPGSPERGEQVYRRACALCHGHTGRGDGVAARYLSPQPRDFTSGYFRFRSTTSRGPTDADLYEIISRGIPRSQMPAWENLLSERDRRDVVAFVKTLSDVFESTGTALVIPPDPGATAESLAEGQHVYMLMQCFKCHGSSGRGDGPSSKTLLTAQGESIKPFDFTVGHYKWGRDGQSIFRTFEAGLNGTPMPSYADAFVFGSEDAESLSGLSQAYSDAELASLKAYLEGLVPAEELYDLPEEELAKILNQRKWALVHYVTSLSRPPSLFRKLFVEDTEVTQPTASAQR